MARGLLYPTSQPVRYLVMSLATPSEAARAEPRADQTLNVLAAALVALIGRRLIN